MNNTNNESISCIATVERIRYYKDNFGIIVCSIDRMDSGELDKDIREDEVIFKGTMPTPIVGNMYNITADYIEDPKWGGQYNIKAMFTAVSFDTADGKKRFLSSIFTEYQIDAMYEALDDPFDALQNEDYNKLVQIKGCGLKTASTWVERFKENINLAKIFLELKDYDLTNAMVDKLLEKYSSPDLVVDKVKNNPYVLCTEVNGIGFKKADEIALKGRIGIYSTARIGAFIQYYLSNCGENGQSWITPDHLLGAILETLGDDVPDEKISVTIGELIEQKILWHNEDKTKIGLRYYYDLATNIATELIRLRDAECDFSYDNWEEVVKHNENVQGWEYTDEQLNAIKSAFNNNVIIITGGAGCGKTSTVSAILKIFKNYSHALCALSGKASSVLASNSGEEGSTIHRLLGFGNGEFSYDSENQLPYDIIVVDEISMIGARLFYFLIRAIKSGAKLIMLGDDGQLESIGCGNVANNMLNSPEIHHNILTKIHRQASKSAIITESIKVRQGTQLINKDWAGKETRGELKDFDLICYSDANNTYYKVIEEFQKLRAKDDFDIMETQIIVPVKNRGMACTSELNNILQELCNPSDGRKVQVTVRRNGRNQIIREGDKVICKKNNYKVEPNIFNGNTGILKAITYNDFDDEVWIIDFKGIGIVELPKKYWGTIELNYCGTVHSNQGSQYNNIIIGLDFSSYSLLTRELVYTAITRAKKKCIMIAQNSALRYAVSNKALSQKQTHLIEALHDVAHPKLVF